ncbi:MAG: hypothetical protein K2O45_11230, partial [Oscillospiraceae bacterium]|nr:hypothetical protein [Oscillospiraceae bacterium]
MKRKTIVTGCLLVFTALLGLWLLTRPSPLCNMRRACSQPETSVSQVSFSGEAGGRIKCTFSTHIKSGTVDFILYDEEGAVIEEFDRADALGTWLSMQYSRTYRREAASTPLTGNVADTW